MKKLMVMIGAVATSLGLFADDFVSKTGFEVDAGSALEDLTVLEDDESSGATWSATGAEKVDVTEYSGTDVGYLPPSAKIGSNNGSKYLSIKTALGTGSLVRNFGEKAADGIYADMNVKFTAFDSDADIPDDAKIAVWVKEDEENGTTNLIVTAGYVDGLTITRKDYVVAQNFEYDQWHRVTIKAIGNSTKGTAAFVVFMDPVIGDDDKMHAEALYSPEEKGTTGWLDGFSDSAKAFDAEGQLFPSLVAEDTLSEVAFSGTGDIDSLVVTDVVPFDEAKDKAFYTLTCGEHIASFKVGDETVTESKQFLFEGATTVSVTDITPATGYFVDSDTDEISVEEATDYTVGKAKALAATVTLADGTVVKAASFEDAIAAFADQGGTLTLNAATTVVEGSDLLELAQDVVIDLNGKTLDLGEATLTSTASLTIQDEAGLGILTAVADSYALDVDKLYVTGGNIKTYATYTTAAELSGGSFIDPEAGAEPFYLNDVVASGKTAVWNDETSMFDIETYVPPVAKIGDDEYKTFAAAFAAVKAGQTIEIIADCTFDEQITIDKAITITIDKDKTLSWTGDKGIYPLFIAADVTINGAGTLLKETESATLVTVNAGAKLTLDGATLKTIASNVIKNLGTFEMKSGFVDGVQRGVKVEGTSAAATFKGGKIKAGTDGTTGGSDKSPIVLDGAQKTQVTIASDSTIKLNVAQNDFAPDGYKFVADGEDTGWFKLGAITYATYKVTPDEGVESYVVSNGTAEVASDAKFDIDDAVTLTVYPTLKADYELDADKSVLTAQLTEEQEYAFNIATKKAAPVNPVIDPTHPTVDVPVTITTKEEALAWAEANVKVATPDETVVTTDAYTAYFKFTVSGDEAPFTVAAELKDEVLKAEAETAEVLTDVLALTESDTITVTNAKPGLYYTLKQGNTLEGCTPGTSVMATADGVELDATKWADAGFYQILVTKQPLLQGN